MDEYRSSVKLKGDSGSLLFSDFVYLVLPDNFL